VLERMCLLDVGNVDEINNEVSGVLGNSLLWVFSGGIHYIHFPE
jgi:hypothetical protein